MTNLERKQIENEYLKKDNVKQDKSEKRTILERKSLKENTFGKETSD